MSKLGLKKNITMSKKAVLQKDSLKISWLTLTKLLMNVFPQDEISVAPIGDRGNGGFYVSIEDSQSENYEGSLCYDPENGIAFAISDTWLPILEEFKIYVEYGVKDSDMMSESELFEFEESQIVPSSYDFLRDRMH